MKILNRWFLHPLVLTLTWVFLAFVALQVFFAARIALMIVVNPESTAFERTQAWQIQQAKGRLPWRQTWVDYDQISKHLKRAVIVSEDDGFVNHDGVDWDALEKAWQKNARAEAQAQRQGKAMAKPPKVVGGSTISQQLAKNLFLSGERTLWRKSQEFIITFWLEVLLSKQRILEIYLNHVEWGEGVFGAEAAAQHYFRKSAAQLSPEEAARLAVMLPRPKYFEKLPNSTYLAERSAVIAQRLMRAELP
jgi:monofunctional biosynthetic peptidoglycan transglycosylase